MEGVNGLPPDDPTWPRDRVIGLVPFHLPVEARRVMRPRFVTLLKKPLRPQPLCLLVAGLCRRGQ